MLRSPAGMMSFPSNRMNHSESVAAVSPPDGPVSCLSFSPATLQQNFLVAGSSDCTIRCWGINTQTRESTPTVIQAISGPVLDVAWSDDGTKVFVTGNGNTAHCWDLQTNQILQMANAHQGPIKTCHWIKAPNYSVLMTGSDDKSLKFWDLRQQEPVLTLSLPEKCVAADVQFPYAVVSPADYGKTLVFKLDETGPRLHKEMEHYLKGRAEKRKCISIFKDHNGAANGFAVGTSKSNAVVQYFSQIPRLKETDFNFLCHRVQVPNRSSKEADIYAVNDLKFHPVHYNTVATVGSDGTFCYWEQKGRLGYFGVKKSDRLDQSVTSSCFNHDGSVFAYAVGHDLSIDKESFDPTKKTAVFIRSCYEEAKPRPTDD